MEIRDFARLGAKTLAGFLSAAVTLHAVYSTLSVDIRADPVLTLLYCAFPGLSFFVFLFLGSRSVGVVIQVLLAVGYLTTASMLNWRTCAELGYCGTVWSTVFETLKTRPLLSAFAVAALSIVALLVNRRSRREVAPIQERGRRLSD